jgi:glycosyltransferase involved in cell wall biosynthesis
MTQLCERQSDVARADRDTAADSAAAARRAVSPPRRVLFISYEFPPVGGAGVQRVTKFVKYLPRKGWAVSVLTVKNPSVPVSDSSLAANVPPETIVRRARTLEPGYRMKAAVSAGESQASGRSGTVRRLLKTGLRQLANVFLQPDPQILWAPSAIREGLKLLREIPHSAIVASGPPFSSLLIGAVLSRRTGVPLVLDYRDEWGISNTYRENRRPNRVSQLVQTAMQRRAIRSAAALVATTPSSARSLQALRDADRCAARVESIYNGFDPEDFASASAGDSQAQKKRDNGFRLAYIGTLWNLTDVEPLVAAVERLARIRPDLLPRLELVFAGRRTGSQDALLNRLAGLSCTLVRLPYVDHGEAMRLLHSADGLCVLLTNTPGADRVVPAKIFEYMAARRPVFAIAPRGELCDIVAKYPGGIRLDPSDPETIAGTLAAEIERVAQGEGPDLTGWDPSEFSRDHQAQLLADILESLVAVESGALAR